MGAVCSLKCKWSLNAKIKRQGSCKNIGILLLILVCCQWLIYRPDPHLEQMSSNCPLIFTVHLSTTDWTCSSYACSTFTSICTARCFNVVYDTNGYFNHFRFSNFTHQIIWKRNLDKSKTSLIKQIVLYSV